MHRSHYNQLEPIQAARKFVRRIIYCDCDEDITIDVPAPPTGYNHIGWALRGSGAKIIDQVRKPVGQGIVHFAGQTVRTSARIILQGRVRHILAELTPIGLFATFGIGAAPLANQVVAVSAYGQPGLQSTLSRVHPDVDMEEALVLFQRALVAEFTGTDVPDYVAKAAGAIEESRGLVSLSSLAQDVSERQLQRNFKHIVGCSPKYFAQLLRANDTILSLTARPKDTLAAIAADHGYSDQSHMVRSMQQFFGNAPSEIRDNVDAMLRAFPTNASVESS